jgi:surface protein
VLRVSNLVSAFDSAGALSSCNKGAIYRLWGATLRAAYPTWSSESSACLVDGNVGTAVTAWITSPTTAAATYGDIGDWNTAAVSNMYRLFYNQPTFNADIGKWNVASVSNMRQMFYDASAFNFNIGAWNTAGVTNMQVMFYTATAFNVIIGSWNTASVTNMWQMFYSATAFNQDIGSWNTASATTMASVRSFYHRHRVRSVGRALMRPALLPPRCMAPPVLAPAAGGCFGFDALAHSVHNSAVAAASAHRCCLLCLSPGRARCGYLT